MSDSAKSCFPAVVNPQTRLLILGSLPGDASLQAAQYYAHPRNQFWRLLGEVLGLDLPAMPYLQRLSAMQAQGVGLWDVVAEAQRRGSLDTAIRAASANDLTALCHGLPRLQAVAFNGATAAGIGRRQLAGLAGRLQLFNLPSSSPAHTMAYASKLAQWLPLREALHRP
ncbi:G:T/U mismatch-specific uracil/thymine DNA-glycosylase [Aquitalea magnusonii]|jgi:hypoxanthine-DNA glycosylase|uniref:G:T/U mismatch-specific uracil/thymine DNA-glycosylase n=1 Tax=Aquitalea magnusonii TaxID=332411 RepID=A0A3G9GJ75_9NEIS|nr:DNA-deoxyinosine glycosylase [Aquitalea magnusonii]BBF85577.1 G:T/U mismatch-specific uracil/thymine DNA-glycosylase [Aquitalea magnusonii]